jgi:hypothetical protein
MARARQL